MMSEQQKARVIDLALGRVSPEAFLHECGSTSGMELASTLLDRAYRDRDADAVECVLIVGFKFGIDRNNLYVLCKLVDADWHEKHEDVVTALDQLADPRSADALHRAAEIVPSYLSFDVSRALAMKAIWALGKVQGQHAEDLLKTLAESQNTRVRESASKQLRRRGGELRD